MDDTTMFLAQTLGLYFVILGALIIIRQSSMLRVFSGLTRSPLALYCIALIELIAGLMLTVAYPQIGTSVEGILSIIGYMLIVESVFYLGVPLGISRKFISKFNTSTWYVSGGLLSIAVGAYLAGMGFGYL
jgi:hypothetical protein